MNQGNSIFQSYDPIACETIDFYGHIPSKVADFLFNQDFHCNWTSLINASNSSMASCANN